MRVLVAIPVFNEAKYARAVLTSVLRYASDVVVIDDGSTDATPDIVREFPVRVIRHAKNAGYGRSLIDAFSFAAREGYDWVLTMDCDEQHEPAAIPMFVSEILRAGPGVDIISGSRYLVPTPMDDLPPADRRRINQTVTRDINRRFGLSLTDSFCGFKAHRVSAVDRMSLTETGYAFPMQFWVQAAALGLGIREVPVKRIYNDTTRTFGGNLDDAERRLAHYRSVMEAEIERMGVGARSGCGETNYCCL
jgi:glycosyltransferase involved in cell wall biosynthesis